MNTACKPGFQRAQGEVLAQISHAIDALRRVLPREISAPDVLRSQAKGNAPAVNLQDLTAAFAEVERMKEILVNEASEVSSEFAAALSHYKRLLKQFKADLPRLQGWLLSERGRLASKRTHSEAVENWARTARQTRW